MPADNEMSDQPDEVEEVDSSAQSLAMAPPARNLWKFRDELLALDCVKHNLRLLQSEDYRRIFPNFPEMDDQVWLTLNTKLNDSIATAESFFRQVNDSNWPTMPTMPVTGVPGAGTGGGNVGSEQSSEDMLLIRRCEETTVKLQDTVGFLSQVLVGHHRKPTGPMRIQAPVRTPRVRRPTRSQLPRLRLDRERNYSTLLNPAFIPRPVRNNLRQTECSSLNERYRVFLGLHKGPMPRRSTPIREQHPKYPRLVAAEHMPLDQVPQERGSSPVELPPVAVLAGELDASEGGHVDESPDGDVEMKDDNSTSKDVLVDDESSKPLDKLPGISEVFANDDFMEEDFSGGRL
ncbi:hypothetical protein F5Y13DRAFT_128465 [Hypoxylon sp. FL1857]|nr:hypothetical protein F5Y13DRAFT_128465 [Hypoxylon sp. FL1857]